MEDKKDYEESLRQMIEQYKKCKKEFDELKFGKEFDEIENIHKDRMKDIDDRMKDIRDRFNRLEELTNQEKQELAEKLDEVSSNLSNLEVVSNNLKVVSNYWSQVQKIQDFLSESGILKINDVGLKKELQKVRNIELPSDEDEEYDSDEWWDEDEGWWKVLSQRRREIGTVLIGVLVPSIFDHYLSEIRECYQYGLFNATVVFCRTLLEIGLKHALETNEKVIDTKRKHPSLDELFGKCKYYRVLTKESWQKADSVRIKANCILHTEEEIIRISEGEALSAVRDTFSVLEEIYR